MIQAVSGVSSPGALALERHARFNIHADLVLRIGAQSWFIVAAAGLWIFAGYITIHYVGSALQGNLEAWNEVFPRGHVPGETLGNLATGIHLFLAAAIIAGGPLQLIPTIRSRFPVFHHWNGRLFMAGSCLASLAGLYLVWIRGGTSGDFWQHLGITLDSILILVFAALALRYAVAREIAVHRRWALRLFLVVNAVWFFRIGLMFWLFVNGARLGLTPRPLPAPFSGFLPLPRPCCHSLCLSSTCAPVTAPPPSQNWLRRAASSCLSASRQPESLPPP